VASVSAAINMPSEGGRTAAPVMNKVTDTKEGNLPIPIPIPSEQQQHGDLVVSAPYDLARRDDDNNSSSSSPFVSSNNIGKDTDYYHVQQSVEHDPNNNCDDMDRTNTSINGASVKDDNIDYRGSCGMMEVLSHHDNNNHRLGSLLMEERRRTLDEGQATLNDNDTVKGIAQFDDPSMEDDDDDDDDWNRTRYGVTNRHVVDLLPDDADGNGSFSIFENVSDEDDGSCTSFVI
jgi:hypothetical protein